VSPARIVARNEWYDALKERDETLYYACNKRKHAIDAEQHALPPKERLSQAQRADIIDAMCGIRDDAKFFIRMQECQSAISKKIAASRKANAKLRSTEAHIPAPPLMVGEGTGEKSPGGELPPLGDLGVVGNPTDILWAVEYLGNETITRQDAPSGTAWTLLCAGRKSPDTLLRIYQGVCVPSKKELEDAVDETDAFDHLDAVLERVIKIAEAAVG
jgi:hypothetical protein